MLLLLLLLLLLRSVHAHSSHVHWRRLILDRSTRSCASNNLPFTEDAISPCSNQATPHISQHRFRLNFPDAILRLLPGEEPRLRAGRHVPARRGQHVLSAGCRHTRRSLLQRAQPHDVQQCCRTILQRLQPLHMHSGLSTSLATGSTSRCPVKSCLKSTVRAAAAGASYCTGRRRNGCTGSGSAERSVA